MTPETITSPPGRDEAPFRSVLRELRNAPPRMRLALWMTAGGIVFAFVVAAADLLEGTDRLEIYRLAGLLFAALGCGALALAQVLHQLAQGTNCSMWQLPVLRFNSLHSSFAATPVICTIAALCMALAIGLMAVSLPERPAVILPMGLVLLYLVLAVQMLASTSAFLYRHARDQAEAAALAKSQAVEAQLSALQAQMNPHFLFNALNTVAALVRTHDAGAEQTVEHLAEVLRRTLDRSRSSKGTVGEEMEYLRAYLAVEQARFGDRLRVDWQVDGETLDVSLPPLTVQPLVENALRHGIGSRLEGGQLSIKVIRSNGDLLLAVGDDGNGFPSRYREGTGLGNLRQRLQTLYGDRSELLVETTTGGSVVTMRLPVINAKPRAT